MRGLPYLALASPPQHVPALCLRDDFRAEYLHTVYVHAPISTAHRHCTHARRCASADGRVCIGR
eukprot:1533860-Rhodomonas_salina.1